MQFSILFLRYLDQPKKYYIHFLNEFKNKKHDSTNF